MNIEKETRILGHISLWAGIAGCILFSCSMLIPLIANNPGSSLPFIFASFASGGLAIALCVICLIRQHKKKKDGEAIAGMILGVLPFPAFFLLPLIAELIRYIQDEWIFY